jgi:hypothetical protein
MVKKTKNKKRWNIEFERALYLMPSDTRKKNKGPNETRKRDEKEINKITDGYVEASVLTSPKRILI